MSRALQVQKPSQLIGPEELEILRNSKFKDFTNNEIAYCAKVANQLNLSPFLNQIHFIKRKLKDGTFVITNQVGIDGFRLTANRAGGYAGSDEPIYEYRTGDKTQNRPIKATVTVYRIVDAVRCAFVASARWEEYYPGDGSPNSFMWGKMPHNQLAKCAESLALRKAFPAELSSLYTEDEMHQADQSHRVAPQQPDPEDGVQDLDVGYRIDFGQWNKRSLEEVYRNVGPREIEKYIKYLEDSAAKRGTPVSEKQQKFIKEAEMFLGSMENATTEVKQE